MKSEKNNNVFRMIYHRPDHLLLKLTMMMAMMLQERVACEAPLEDNGSGVFGCQRWALVGSFVAF